MKNWLKVLRAHEEIGMARKEAAYD